MLPISVNPETSALVEISEPSCLAPTITALSLKSTHYSIPTRCFNFSWFFHPCPNAPKHWVSAMGLPGRDRQEEKVVSRYVEEFWWQSEEEILYHLPTPPPCSGERSLHSTFFSLSYFLTRNGSVIYLFIYFAIKAQGPRLLQYPLCSTLWSTMDWFSPPLGVDVIHDACLVFWFIPLVITLEHVSMHLH